MLGKYCIIRTEKKCSRHRYLTMRTDSIFYLLFKLLPGTFFELIGKPDKAKNYEFTSEEIKETAFRIDGLFKSSRKSSPLYFTEVQFQPKDDFYGKLFAEIFTYLYRKKPKDWRAVAIFATRSLDPGVQKQYKELFKGQRLQRIYLDELKVAADSSLGLKTIQLIVEERESQEETVELARELVVEVSEEFADDVLTEAVVQLVKTIVVYKLPNLSRQELEAMFELADLKETRYFQDVKAEFQAEAELKTKQESVPRLLALGLTVEQIATALALDVELVKEAAENSAANPPTEENTNN